MHPTPAAYPAHRVPLLISHAPGAAPWLTHKCTHTRTHTHTALTVHPRASVARVWARNSSLAVLREKRTDWVREGRTWGPSRPPRPPPDSENWGNGKVWPQGLAASPNPWGFSQLQNIYFRAWRSLSTRAALGDPQRGQRKRQGLKGVGLEMGHGTSPWKRDRERSWSLKAGRRQVSTAPPSQALKDRPFCWSGWGAALPKGSGRRWTHSLTKPQALHLQPHPQAPRVAQGTPARRTGWCHTPRGQAELTCPPGNSPHLRPRERG